MPRDFPVFSTLPPILQAHSSSCERIQKHSEFPQEIESARVVLRNLPQYSRPVRGISSARVESCAGRVERQQTLKSVGQQRRSVLSDLRSGVLSNLAASARI